jgi:hypothetical protein
MEDVKPWIVCAAMKSGEITVCGARHFDGIMRGQVAIIKMSFDVKRWEQGFIDQWGKFYNRKEAMQIVKDNGQPFSIERNGGKDDELYSEGLY